MTNTDHSKSPCGCSKGADAEAAIRILGEDLRRMVDTINMLVATLPIQDTSLASRARHSLESLERIVGGRPTDLGYFDECCCLGGSQEQDWFCSGVLIAPRIVLTAAHCTPRTIARVLMGARTINHGHEGDLIAVTNVIVHPMYDPSTQVNDLAILVLERDAKQRPAKLATTELLLNAEDCHLVGFGYNDPVKPHGFGVKRHVNVPIAALRRTGEDAELAELAVEERMLGFSSSIEFVAGRKHLGRDSCNGDSGGPAYIRVGDEYYVAGITSRATLDARSPCGDGGIYVRVDSYRAWIDAMLGDCGTNATWG